MKKYCAYIAIVLICFLSTPTIAQNATAPAATPTTQQAPKAAATGMEVLEDEDLQTEATQNTPHPSTTNESTGSVHQRLKKIFIDGNAAYMSLVALALLLGLVFCIERIIYLNLSDIPTDKLLSELDSLIANNQIEEAKDLCRNTPGPVASICYQGLARIDSPIDEIERSIIAYGGVLSAKLEKGCAWISLFIAMAPSLGFLGTVIGMVMAFEQIQTAGDISPIVVASGMKVALITTIFGIIVALVLQVFYNFILTKIEKITIDMEEAAITLLDELVKFKRKKANA